MCGPCLAGVRARLPVSAHSPARSLSTRCMAQVLTNVCAAGDFNWAGLPGDGCPSLGVRVHGNNPHGALALLVIRQAGARARRCLRGCDA